MPKLQSNDGSAQNSIDLIQSRHYVFRKGGPLMPTVRIPADIENRLEKLADLEDHYLAEERLRENRPAIPLDEVERTLGLAD